MAHAMLRHFDFLIPAGVLLVYCLVPVLTVWGWFRWNRERKPRHAIAAFSYAGFALATFSALLALYSITHSSALDGASDSASSPAAIFYWGLWISAIAAVLALTGVWRRNPLRWHAALCSLGILLFWSTTFLE